MANTPITLADVLRGATELQLGELTEHSVKLALWAAILSANASLLVNTRQMDVLREYVDGLPVDRDTLYRQMEGTGRFTRVKCGGLYYVESLECAGKLAGLENIGATYAEQCAWRDHVYNLMHGHGMAWKTVSLAALILQPMACELVPVDRHVLARFGFASRNSPPRRGRYLAIETLVRDERALAGYDHIPLALWHWLTWEQWRQATGASKAHGGVESHIGLSCRAR